MSHWYHLNIWPDELINLNRETVHHPKLMERLANHPSDQWEVKITEIANYCEVIVDGDYVPEQMVQLAGILHKKLIERREDNRGLIVITSSTLQ
jgi:hypothetical protein